MKLIDAFLKKLNNFFSDTNQIRRIIIFVGIALVLAVISFGSYYYYDRYYTSQPKTADVMLEQALQAVRDDPQNPEARLNLAEVYMVNRRFDDAIEMADYVMKAYPDNQRAWFVIGVANALKENYADAIDPLQKYLDANKDSDMPGLNKPLQSAAYYLGESYLQLGDAEHAIPPLEMVVTWSQMDADAMYKLGTAYNAVKEYEKAALMFHAATTFVPNFTEAYSAMVISYEGLEQPQLVEYARGMEAYSVKDYSTAIEYLTKSVQADPGFAPTFSGLGLTYEAMGDLANAKSNYEIALKLNPSDYAASTGLERVETLLNK